jgi:hypothetical protein
MKVQAVAKLVLLVTFCLIVPQSGRAERVPRLEKRCGWIVNPTPGNWEFFDRHGQWEIARQGEEGAVDGLPEDRPTGKNWWVATNSGGYGYGCICLDVISDKQAKKLVKIEGGKSLPLKRCRTDRSIRKVEFSLR